MWRLCLRGVEGWSVPPTLVRVWGKADPSSSLVVQVGRIERKEAQPEARVPLPQLSQGPRRTSSQAGSGQGKSRSQTKLCGFRSSWQNRSPRLASTLPVRLRISKVHYGQPHLVTVKCSPASCCAFNPGGRLPFRIFWIVMGLRNSVDSATEFLNSCPPPSSMLPSITSGGMTDAMTEYGRDHPTRIDDVYESLAGVEIVITSHPTSRPAAGTSILRHYDHIPSPDLRQTSSQIQPVPERNYS